MMRCYFVPESMRSFIADTVDVRKECVHVADGINDLEGIDYTIKRSLEMDRKVIVIVTSLPLNDYEVSSKIASICSEYPDVFYWWM